MREKMVRFAEFELDFGGYQLCRWNDPVRLESLPLRILMLLVERHRELVTREEIADALWGKEVFVDVEQGINTAIRKIRMALEDDSHRPKFLQTVVGRGYRFIAPIASQAVLGDSADCWMFSPEELGRAVMAAAGLDYEVSKVRSEDGREDRS